MTRARAAKNMIIVLATKVAVATLPRLPQRALVALGRALAMTAFVLLGGARAIATENLAIAFPALSRPARRRLARRAYATLGGLVGAALSRLHPRAPAPAPLALEDASSVAALARARENPRGVVLLSAHLGPYEEVARSLLAHGVPLLAVTKRAYDPRLDFVLARLRAGVPTVARDEPGAAMRMVRHLRAGGVLGIPMDLASRVPSLDVPFFDVPARTALGPARIALRTGASVVVCTAVRAGVASYAMRITEVSTADSVAKLPNRELAERALLRHVNAELCARILAMPEAWPWMHPRFSGAPEDPSRAGHAT